MQTPLVLKCGIIKRKDSLPDEWPGIVRDSLNLRIMFVSKFWSEDTFSKSTKFFLLLLLLLLSY